MTKSNSANPLDLTDFESSLKANLERAANDPEYIKDLTTPKKGNPITLGPRVTSADDWAKKQVTRASAAAEDWLNKVTTPRRNPIDAMKAASAKRKQKVAEAEAQGKWDKAVAKIDEGQMYNTIRKRGAAAFRSGVEDRADKVTARVKEIQPMVAALADTIDKMPDATDAQREARLLAARRGMITIGKQRLGIA